MNSTNFGIISHAAKQEKKRQLQERAKRLVEAKRAKIRDTVEEDSIQTSPNFNLSANSNVLMSITNSPKPPKKTRSNRLQEKQNRAAVARASGKRISELTNEKQELESKITELRLQMLEKDRHIKELEKEKQKLTLKLLPFQDKPKNHKKLDEYRSPSYRRSLIKKFEEQTLGDSFKIVPKDKVKAALISENDDLAIRAATTP